MLASTEGLLPKPPGLEDAFGQALMQDYSVDYLSNVDGMVGEAAAQRSIGFCSSSGTPQCWGLADRCPVVGLGPEVSDFSDPSASRCAGARARSSTGDGGHL